MAAQAAFPVASVEFQSWETCDDGYPAVGTPKFKADITANPATCDKTPVNRDWSIDHYSFKSYLDTKDALMCSGVTVWNNDGCSGEPAYFLPFTAGPSSRAHVSLTSLSPDTSPSSLNASVPAASKSRQLENSARTSYERPDWLWRHDYSSILFHFTLYLSCNPGEKAPWCRKLCCWCSQSLGLPTRRHVLPRPSLFRLLTLTTTYHVHNLISFPLRRMNIFD